MIKSVSKDEHFYFITNDDGTVQFLRRHEQNATCNPIEGFEKMAVELCDALCPPTRSGER